jgi:hypothetical protein
MLLRPMPATLSSAGRLAMDECPPECPSTARTFTPGRAQWTRVDGRRGTKVRCIRLRRLAYAASCGA